MTHARSSLSRQRLYDECEDGRRGGAVIPSSNDDARVQVALSRVVTRDYFATVGARLREGRFFDASDRRSQSPAAVVNESFANRNFPGGKPLGARFNVPTRWGGHTPAPSHLRRVTGAGPSWRRAPVRPSS
jgi:hypothetical protein